MLSKPVREAGLIDVSAGEREDNGDDLFLRRFNAKAVQTEEKIHGLEGDALVPVDERMVVGETETICCS